MHCKSPGENRLEKERKKKKKPEILKEVISSLDNPKVTNWYLNFLISKAKKKKKIVSQKRNTVHLKETNLFYRL